MDKSLLNIYRKNINDIANLLPSWEERINKEILLLENILKDQL